MVGHQYATRCPIFAKNTQKYYPSPVFFGGVKMKRGGKDELKHVIYCSRPTYFSDVILKQILRSSRKNNVGWGVSGNLICRKDLYFQLLEGPPEGIDKLYEKILTDNRHLGIQKLCDEKTNRRLFASWAMKFDPYKSWMWTEDELKAGALKKLSSDDALAIFEKLARETDQFLGSEEKL